MNSRTCFLLCSLASLSLVTMAGCAAPTSEDGEASATSDSALSSVTAGADVSVTEASKGTTNGTSCTHVDATDFAVRYENHALPWGTRVELHSGWGFYEGEPYEWLDVRDADMSSAAGWTWEAHRTIDWQTAAAGPLRLDFVVKITMPDGRVVWDNTGGSGFYLAEIGGTCDGSVRSAPLFHSVSR
jgi:hypothetical protein